jgi:predicted RNase H-like nuclease
VQDKKKQKTPEKQDDFQYGKLDFVMANFKSELKGYEDAIDAVVCAWIGCEFLAGRCVAYGDMESAIWLPDPNSKNIV